MLFSQDFPQNFFVAYNVEKGRERKAYLTRDKGVSIFGNSILSGSLLSDSYKWQLSARFTPGRRYAY